MLEKNMAQNKRAVSKIEFNKRIRDLVSRDSNRLRQTFEKFDKECATRLAEIQSMQEKVRYSMRNLKQEKMQAKLNLVNDTQLEGSENGSLTQQESPASDKKDLKSDNHRTFIPGIPFNRSDHLEVPGSSQTKTRRHSVPHRPTFLPGSPKEIRAFPRTTMSSSQTKQAYAKPASPTETSLLSNLSSSPKESSSGTSHYKVRNNLYRLSISDLPISKARSDNLSNIRVKLSPQSGRRSHHSKNNWVMDNDEKEIFTHDNQDTKNPRRSSHTPSHLGVTMETESRRASDPHKVRPKSLVKRTRSSSLPFEPDMVNREAKPKEIHYGVTRSAKSVNRPLESKAVPIPVLDRKENEADAGLFEELRHCTYLRNRTENDPPNS